MVINVVFAAETKFYVRYESPDMDFTNSGVKCKIWIPKTEIQTNIPGVFPPEITLAIQDDSGAEVLEEGADASGD